MIDAEIQNGQISKRYIFINLRPVAVIEYEIYGKNDSASGSKYAGYKPKSTAIYAIHTDHLGTPQAITNDKQAVVWRADYATFGKATVQARVVDSTSKTAKTTNSFGIISTANAATVTGKPFEFNLRFAGQYEDSESGYHYNWHRYYDPSTGRYLTPDPIGLAGGLNGYGYAGQDPMGAVDPWGLMVYGVYSRSTNTLAIKDTDPAIPVLLLTDATSGGLHGANALALGEYDIIDWKPNEFRLDIIDSKPGNDINDNPGADNGRSLIRLHGPGQTSGCIAVQKDWDKLNQYIRSTKTTELMKITSWSTIPGTGSWNSPPLFNPVEEYKIKYGTIKVVD
jgi:RHS repeat-associated protein